MPKHSPLRSTPFWRAAYGLDIPAMKLLMFDHAFLQCERVLLTVGEHNLRSRRAVTALGAREVGETQHVHQGRLLRSLVYAMTQEAWSGGCRAAVQQRLLQRLDAAPVTRAPAG